MAELSTPLRTVLGFSLVVNLAMLAPSIFMLQVYDRVLTTRSVETLWMLGIIAGTTLVLMGLLDHLRARTLSAIGVQIEQQHGPRLLRQLLVSAARDGGRSYADGMRDLALIRNFLAGAGVVALCDAPWTVVYLALIFAFSTELGLLATVFTVLLVLLAVVNERATRGTIAELHDGSRQAAQVVDASLRNAEVVAALGMPVAVVHRWQAHVDRNHALQLQLSHIGGRITALSRFSRQAIHVMMLGYGAYLVIHDGATPGVMLATTIILARALAPVEMLIGNWKTMVDARQALGRLRAVLEQPTEGEVTTALPRPLGRLSAEGLGYRPPGADRPLLHGVSLQAEPGQVLAIVGPSGSGKTTLARLLVGVTRPSAGHVRLDGADLASWDPVRLGAWVGYLPQGVELFDGTVGENIARLGPIDSDAVVAAAQAARAHELILRLPAGYETRVGEGGNRLSGGQRQRVALARALYGEPALVILDEADASLDAEGEQALLEAIRALKARGATVLVITQRRGVLAAADTVIVMKDGAIDRTATVEPTAGVPAVRAVPSVMEAKR